MDTPIVDEVIEQLKALLYELQWRVLEFTRALALSTPHGVSGQQLLPLQAPSHWMTYS